MLRAKVRLSRGISQRWFTDIVVRRRRMNTLRVCNAEHRARDSNLDAAIIKNAATLFTRAQCE
jgi:hypothetical protein